VIGSKPLGDSGQKPSVIGSKPLCDRSQNPSVIGVKERGVLIGLAYKFMPESYLQMKKKIQGFLLFKEEKDASSAFFVFIPSKLYS